MNPWRVIEWKSAEYYLDFIPKVRLYVLLSSTPKSFCLCLQY